MKDCIFCKIVKGRIPSFKIWEDEEFLAILDIHPNTKGMTLLMTKKHYPSYLPEMPDSVYQRFWLAAKKLAKQLDEKLGTKRTAMVMEGTGVNHAHIKFYPLHGLEKSLQESEKTVYYKKYPGFIDTRVGPKMPMDDLKKMAKKIKG